MYSCPICKNKPNSHSFFKLGEENKKTIFYSSDNGHDKTPLYVLNHIEGELSNHHHNSHNKEWVWVFDSKDLNTEFDVNNLEFLKGVLDILKKYRSTLHSIVIINTNYLINLIISLINPFLDDDIKKLIIIQS
jgi:hypothetical protein